MWGEALTAGTLGAAGVLAWAVRGRSSTLLSPGVWRGPGRRKELAFTFDDGPSEATPALLELLARHSARATFFVVGAHVRRLPHILRAIADEGHEIGNHTDTHPALYLRSADFIEEQVARCQKAVMDVAGFPPVLFRPPYGARWFGLRAALERHHLRNVMWSTIAGDWRADAAGAARRILRGARPGAIFCLHDGREMQTRPDIGVTLSVLEAVLPRLSAEGFRFVTVSELLCPETKSAPA